MLLNQIKQLNTSETREMISKNQGDEIKTDWNVIKKSKFIFALFYNKIGEENADRYKFRIFSCNSFVFIDVIFNLFFSIGYLGL